jgi:hypothetical protein
VTFLKEKDDAKNQALNCSEQDTKVDQAQVQIHRFTFEYLNEPIKPNDLLLT